MNGPVPRHLAGLFLALLLTAAIWPTPEYRAAWYVIRHQTELQADMDAFFLQGKNLSYDGSFLYVNDWPGQHSMVEYVFMEQGGRLYGFYYSPDNVPLAFQNIALPLQETRGGGGTGAAAVKPAGLLPAGFSFPRQHKNPAAQRAVGFFRSL